VNERCLVQHQVESQEFRVQSSATHPQGREPSTLDSRLLTLDSRLELVVEPTHLGAGCQVADHLLEVPLLGLDDTVEDLMSSEDLTHAKVIQERRLLQLEGAGQGVLSARDTARAVELLVPSEEDLGIRDGPEVLLLGAIQLGSATEPGLQLRKLALVELLVTRQLQEDLLELLLILVPGREIAIKRGTKLLGLDREVDGGGHRQLFDHGILPLWFGVQYNVGDRARMPTQGLPTGNDRLRMTSGRAHPGQPPTRAELPTVIAMEVTPMVNDRVLLVDDEEDFVTNLAKRLDRRGYRVETASGGEDAVARVKQSDFDVIVLDLAMPGIDGIETLKRLKAADPELQVILLTGHATVATGVEAMKLGASDLLQKPAELEELLETINKARSRRALLVQRRMEEEVADILINKGW
jgi:ActR/RegA family two-component response regulator